MSDLILLTRLEALKGNLAQVQQVLDAVAQQRDELTQIERLMADREQSIRASLTYLSRALSTARDVARELEWDNLAPPELLQSVEEADKQVLAISNFVKDAQSLLRRRRGRFIEIGNESEVGSTVNMTLVNQASLWMRELDTLQEALLEKIRDAAAKEAQAEAAGDGEGKRLRREAQELRQEAWSEYREKTLVNIRPIFTEYVDFLRGLAVRDLGFDAGICQLADELVRKLRLVPNTNWESLTILAREEAVDRTMAKIIRLPFPGWTIWALPLVAHEFGHLVSEINEVRAFVDDKSSEVWSHGVMRDCLADAFATYAMGPAYATSTILLRFDPIDAFSDLEIQASHAKRAAVVLAMLGHMDGKASPSRYGDIIAALETAWHEALAQAAPGKNLTPDETGFIDELVVFLADYLDAQAKVDYTVAAMDSIADWPAKLIAGDADIRVRAHDLRDVLNAAWLARLQAPDRVEDIRKAATALWDRMAAPESAPRPGRQPAGWGAAPNVPAAPARNRLGNGPRR